MSQGDYSPAVHRLVDPPLSRGPNRRTLQLFRRLLADVGKLRGKVMAIDALVLPFLKVPLFQGLKPLQITEIARRAHRIVYRPGDVIVHANAESDAAVLLIAGEAIRISGPGLEAGEEVVPVGSLLSEMTMLIETESTSTIVARTSVRALRITRSEMLAHMAEDPAVADHFIAKISSRLAEFVEGLREIDRSLAGADGEAADRLPDISASAAAQAALSLGVGAATLH